MTHADHVALLGTKGGPAIRPGSAMPTASLLVLGGRRIVIDCGLGVARGLTLQGMALADLDLVFITHLHSDHYLELGPLLHTAWTAGLKNKVRVFGPPGLGDYWSHFVRSMQFDIDLRIEDEGRPDLRSLVSITEIGEGSIFDEPGLRVEAMRNVHPPIADSFALAFHGNGRKVVFSGDTAPVPQIVEFAAGADLLIHEAMLEQAVDALVARVGNTDGRLKRHLMRSHSLAPEVGRMATAAGVRALAINHLIPADDPNFTVQDWKNAIQLNWNGPLHVGSDGLRITLA
ncbi:MAG TPA: MBL fold metallo-hydrolase [Rhizobiaceae bacterium]|nr:MBL fold metallo-hydrolase [Rhizobiaceae bacterium]